MSVCLLRVGSEGLIGMRLLTSVIPAVLVLPFSAGLMAEDREATQAALDRAC